MFLEDSVRKYCHDFPALKQDQTMDTIKIKKFCS